MSTFSISAVCNTRQRQISTQALMWEGIAIQLCYEADWLNLAALGFAEPCAHLELHVLHPADAPLPVGDFGYWSEFIDACEVEEAGGPAALARALLDEFAATTTWRVRWAKWEQRDLF